MALELAEQHINVNVVSATIHRSRAAADAIPYRETIKKDIPLGRFGEPIEIAHAVRFVCSPEADFVTGSVMTVDGGSGASHFHLPISST